jgi:hypothetical protein
MNRLLYALLGAGGLFLALGCHNVQGFNDCDHCTHGCLYPYAGVGHAGGAVILNAEPIPTPPKDKGSGSGSSSSSSPN